MNKRVHGTRSNMLKGVCTAMIIVLGASLFAAGAMGSDGCGMKCCCQTGPSNIKAQAEIQMRSPMGCCSGLALNPCDLQSARPIKLPEITRSSCCWQISHVDGATITFSELNEPGLNIGSKSLSQLLDPNFNPPPLYIQKLSFLI